MGQVCGCLHEQQENDTAELEKKNSKPMPKSIVSDTNKVKVDPFSESGIEKNVPSDDIVLTDGPRKDNRSSTVEVSTDHIIGQEIAAPIIGVDDPDQPE